ncbi:MAG: hypothetical protein OHK93_008351 [Ramalina farinacea]|uniref:Uncharacterized protein n=1 Tax=Ramalina farinacea TaxID=258253 RepID=A0AA43QMA0_9LECA|nr:hypothetical protein [Ramalina farinacea]
MWYHPHLRYWLTIRAYEPFFPLASEILVSQPSSSWPAGLQRALSTKTEKRWWARIMTTPVNKNRVGFGFLVKGEDEGAAATQGEPEWVPWGNVCAPRLEDDAEREKVMCEGTFGDGLGGWVDPHVYPPFWDVEGENM